MPFISRSTTTQQQADYQAKAGRNSHGLPWVTTDVGFGRFNNRLGAVANAGHRVQCLLELDAQLRAQCLCFFTNQSSTFLEQFVGFFDQCLQVTECLILDLIGSLLSGVLRAMGVFLSSGGNSVQWSLAHPEKLQLLE